ncbi:MAG: cyclomaltodextrinase N-terminal domain-containing protein, partial [Ekhidna sp.]
MRLLSVLLMIFGCLQHPFSQTIHHIDPPFWWSDMPTQELQIMLHGEGLGNLTPSIDREGISIESIESLSNKNYLVLNLLLDEDIKPGIFEIVLSDVDDVKTNIDYELKSRTNDTNRNLGFDASDVIYLLMPDRFSNGDPSNDTIAGMLEGVDRN